MDHDIHLARSYVKERCQQRCTNNPGLYPFGSEAIASCRADLACRSAANSTARRRKRSKEDHMRVSEASSAESGVVGSMREGVLELKFLLTGQDGSTNNYVLMMNRTGSGGWSTPRHRHNFDQLRYIIKGTYPYAKGKVMPEGWVGYFPESVHYGRQERPEGL